MQFTIILVSHDQIPQKWHLCVCVYQMEIQSTGSLVASSLRALTIANILSLFFRFISKWNTITQKIFQIPHLKCITTNYNNSISFWDFIFSGSKEIYPNIDKICFAFFPLRTSGLVDLTNLFRKMCDKFTQFCVRNKYTEPGIFVWLH